MITDEMLRDAAPLVNEALLSVLPSDKDCKHEFSKSFKRKMNRLIRHTKYRSVYVFLKAAACFFLVFILGTSMFLTINVKAREAFFAWIKEKYEFFIEYYFDGTINNEPLAHNELPEYKLGWIPEGYTEHYSYKTLINAVTTYLNSKNELIQFSYYPSTSSPNLFIEQELYEYSSITIRNTIVEIYISKDNDKTSLIIWSDTEQNILFSISAFADSNTLIKMFKEIIFVE